MHNNSIDWTNYLAAVWRTHKKFLKPIKDIDFIDLDSLIGIDQQIEQLCFNTELFLSGKKAHHALLWGARGMGKSSLIKGILNKYHGDGLRVIEIPKDDLIHLLDITDDIRDQEQKFIIFCDDLSFEEGDASYKSLKSSLEGTIEAQPKNVLVYATSNRRHLIPEKMSENRQSELIDGEIHQGDAIEEKVSLSDRFGLMLSFYAANQDTYLQMVDSYFSNVDDSSETSFEGGFDTYSAEDIERLHRLAIQYATQKGNRSGRIAKQFFTHYQFKTLK